MKEEEMNIKTRRILGYAGLLPFFIFSLFPLFISFPEGYIFNLLLSFYGGIILSFLGGTTWGWQVTEKENTSLVFGVVISLQGFLIITISNMFLFYSLCFGFIGFIIFYLYELRYSPMMDNVNYRFLRRNLTIGVSFCYLLSISAFNW